MPAIIRSPRSRPPSGPAYYLARPASVWITALHRQPPAAHAVTAGTGAATEVWRTADTRRTSRTRR